MIHPGSHPKPAPPGPARQGRVLCGSWFWRTWPLLCLSLALQGAELSLETFTIDSGGGASSDGFFELQGTWGQPDTGVSSDGFYTLQSGFWSASLTAPPMIVTQPSGAFLDFGQAITLEAEVAGSPPFLYQWHLNTTRLASQTNASLVLTNFMLSQSGAYSVVIRNAFGFVRSNPALVLPTAPEITPADNFANRVPLGPADTLFQGSNQGATREPGEPDHASRWSGSSVWYTWGTNVAGILRIRTLGSTFDSLLAVYTGTDLVSLSEVDADDDGAGFLGSEVRFNVDPGVSYHIAVDGLGRRQGSFVLSLDFQATNERLPQILNHPVSRSIRPNEPATFSSTVLGNSLQFQWFRNNAPVPGATGSSFSSLIVKPIQLGSYFLAVTNAAGRGLRSRPASLEFGPRPDRVTYSKIEDLLFNARLTDTGNNLAPPPAPDLLPRNGGSGGAPVPVGFVSVSVGTIDQQVFRNNDGTNSLECAGCEPGAGLAKYFGLETDQSGLLVLDTIGSSVDTVMSVFEYESAAAFLSDPCSFLVQCDADSAPDGTNSLIRFEAASGQRYIVMVDSQSGALGSMVLNWELCPVPSPFQIMTNSLVLTITPNPHPYPNDTNYYWHQDGLFLNTTTDPVLAAHQPALNPVHYSVAYQTAREGTVSWFTNDIGSFLTAAFQLDSSGANPVLHLLLSGAAGLPFQVEGTVPGSEQDPVCETPWLWTAVTNYSMTQEGSTTIISLPMESSSRFYRIRPGPIETTP